MFGFGAWSLEPYLKWNGTCGVVSLKYRIVGMRVLVVVVCLCLFISDLTLTDDLEITIYRTKFQHVVVHLHD